MAVQHQEAISVGALAKRAGISVRTLHYYDEIHLLSPSERSGSGRRRYTSADVARLQQILSLRQLGFALGDIASMLGSAEFTLRRVLEMHVERLRESLVEQQKLLQRLEHVASAVGRSGLPPVEELLLALEDLAQSEKYFTAEQRERIAARARTMGSDAIREGERRWAVLLDDIRDAMRREADARSPEVRSLADRWRALVREFTGGDAGIHQSLNRRWSEERNVHGIDTSEIRSMCDYLFPAAARAAAAPGGES